MSISYISRCGSCSSEIIYENQNDLCDLPTPSKYNACYQKIYSSLDPGCEPGYNISCDYNVEGSRALLCCPNIITKDNIFDINCNDNGTGCSIKIAYQNKRLECSSKSSFLACLNDPDTTYVNNIQNEFPIPWLIYPKEIYDAVRDISSPCGGLDDFSCLPYSELFKANSLTDINGVCPSGKLNNYAYFNNNVSCSILESKGDCTRTTNSTCLTGMTKMDNCDNNGSILCCTMPESECYTMSNFIPSNNIEKDVFCQMACPSYQDQLLINIKNPCDSTYYDLCNSSGCQVDPACQTGWLKQQIPSGALMPNKLPTVINNN
jgi:hypothetical protein